MAGSGCIKRESMMDQVRSRDGETWIKALHDLFNTTNNQNVVVWKSGVNKAMATLDDYNNDNERFI